MTYFSYFQLKEFSFSFSSIYPSFWPLIDWYFDIVGKSSWLLPGGVKLYLFIKNPPLAAVVSCSHSGFAFSSARSPSFSQSSSQPRQLQTHGGRQQSCWRCLDIVPNVSNKYQDNPINVQLYNLWACFWGWPYQWHPLQTLWLPRQERSPPVQKLPSPASLIAPQVPCGSTKPLFGQSSSVLVMKLFLGWYIVFFFFFRQSIFKLATIFLLRWLWWLWKVDQRLNLSRTCRYEVASWCFCCKVGVSCQLYCQQNHQHHPSIILRLLNIAISIGITWIIDYCMMPRAGKTNF